METVYIGFSIRVWVYAGNPDNDVHTSGGAYADIGEPFINTNTGQIFLCTNNISGSMTWTPYNAAVLQSDWTQSTTSAQDYIKNKPSLAAVATSGSYNDLSNKPTIPSAQIQSDWSQSNNTLADYIKNKPSLATVATTGAYSDLSGKPSLATVATTGSYNDLSNKPSIPAAQIQSDWTQSNNTLADYIKNKPSLATVATTGAYSDLSGKPSLATVATTGSYNDLSNKPSIPAAQIQSDWTQTNTSSLDYIKNKPAARSQSSASRNLNSIFQISSTRDSSVTYSVDIACTSTLVGGQSGTVFLEISTSSSFASGVQEIGRFTNANAVSLAIAITLNQTNTACISGYVPAGYYVRLRTANNVGTPTFTYQSGQEVLL